MLKVDPKFKLDRQFRGPYPVHNVTATCVYIQPINMPNSDVICVSLQWLSRCTGQGLKSAQPWLGHGKTRRRRQVRQTTRLPSEHDDNNDSISDQVIVQSF